MDFNLSQEHLMLRDLYRKFAENEVKPLAEEVDEEERFPRREDRRVRPYRTRRRYRRRRSADHRRA